jgi:hypothetical protein
MHLLTNYTPHVRTDKGIYGCSPVSKAATFKSGRVLMIVFPTSTVSNPTAVARRQRHLRLGHSEHKSGNDAWKMTTSAKKAEEQSLKTLQKTARLIRLSQEGE